MLKVRASVCVQLEIDIHSQTDNTDHDPDKAEKLIGQKPPKAGNTCADICCLAACSGNGEIDGFIFHGVSLFFAGEKNPLGAGMEFTDWMWLKVAVIGGLAFLYGIWHGFTGR